MKSMPLFPTVKSISIIKDSRGWFAPILKTPDVDKNEFGQISLTVINPYGTKGNHYHKIKYEWFYVVSGRVKFDLYHIDTKQKINIILGKNKDDSQLKILCIPPRWHHKLHNTLNKEAIVVIYYHPFFDQTKNDESNDIYIDKEI